MTNVIKFIFVSKINAKNLPLYDLRILKKFFKNSSTSRI